MIKYLLILILVNFTSYGLNATENKILFKINNKSITKLDYENRISYLEFIGENSYLDKNMIMQDFISVNLFYEYYILNSNNLLIEEKINEIFENFIKQNKIQQRNVDGYNKENIYNNLKLDFARKSIIENILNSKKNDIFKNEKNKNILYEFNISYINLYHSELSYLEEELNNIKFTNMDNIEDFLSSKNIKYFKKEKKINEIENLNIKIKNAINANQKLVIINNKNTISFISIEKDFITYEGLKAILYSFETNENLSQDEINCQKLNDLENINVTKKEYDFVKLNKTIKENLKNINDFISFNSEDTKTFVFLCGIKYDENILSNLNINNKINKVVDKIENDFVKRYSKIFNLNILNE